MYDFILSHEKLLKSWLFLLKPNGGSNQGQCKKTLHQDISDMSTMETLKLAINPLPLYEIRYRCSKKTKVNKRESNIDIF